MIQKDAIEILKSIQDGLEETRFLERCAIDMAIEALNTHDDLCENLAWYINERQRLLKVIEYSKPNEGLQRTIKKALERPHGKWEVIGRETFSPNITYRCSACKTKEISCVPNDKPHYCENCGADMLPKEGDVE